MSIVKFLLSTEGEETIMLTKLIGVILRQPLVHNKLLEIRSARRLSTSCRRTARRFMYRYCCSTRSRITSASTVDSVLDPHPQYRHADLDRHTHDHPFNARTWVMRGGYTVRRELLTTHRVVKRSVQPSTSRDTGRLHTVAYRGPGKSTTGPSLSQDRRSMVVARSPFVFGKYLEGLHGGW
jgi:hypothetical protein